jgi:hypothetical protein
VITILDNVFLSVNVSTATPTVETGATVTFTVEVTNSDASETDAGSIYVYNWIGGASIVTKPDECSNDAELAALVCNFTSVMFGNNHTHSFEVSVVANADVIGNRLVFVSVASSSEQLSTSEKATDLAVVTINVPPPPVIAAAPVSQISIAVIAMILIALLL